MLRDGFDHYIEHCRRIAAIAQGCLDHPRLTDLIYTVRCRRTATIAHGCTTAFSDGFDHKFESCRRIAAGAHGGIDYLLLDGLIIITSVADALLPLHMAALTIFILTD